LKSMICTRDVPPLRSLDAAFDRELEAIVARAVERDVADRIATAAKLAEYLECYLDGQPVDIRKKGIVRRARRWIRTRPTTSALAALGLVVAVLVGLGSLWYWDRYQRVKVTYFRTWVTRHGVKEGVGPLTEAEAPVRWYTYRFATRGGLVERVDVVNGAGEL